ncbi:SDR family NAD(P)-dependent oxidoreductase [Hydrogenophaga sp. BPS33]|uniref:SDR family NAD(P)-dependent oxidoreductase n=1 Tax=Hydrogenophaga sp. BPS33 TaxID=2651974 RepID=UPI00132033C9|nr:SDR family NAD(P)-dependent oxidoreductase [Hydrogenophaga sp. BPS33]QHE84501.1 SDR family oxidoreductase [Hydrogenophaga sp. BPS33]
MSHSHPHPPFQPDDTRIAGRLAGRRILVTGAASGIGRAIAELFLRAGARVLALDRHRPADFAGDAELWLACEADITDPQAVERAVQSAVGTFGGLDGVVNAAGIANTDWADEVSLDDWKRVIDVNLTGTFNVCRAALPEMRAAGAGTIVNLSSGQGLQPFKQRSAYAASKAGVIAFSKSIAMEWAPQVRVNTICPGAVDTPMVRGGYTAEQLHSQVGPRYALERIGEPQEIALAALYLSSDESSFVTGITLAVDGGRSYH